jgi:hypothetical protein
MMKTRLSANAAEETRKNVQAINAEMGRMAHQ